MNTEDVVHVYTMKYYLVIKKNKILPLETTWMNVESIMLSEISQTKKDKYCMISLICGVYKTNKTHRYREQTGDYQRGGWLESG